MPEPRGNGAAIWSRASAIVLGILLIVAGVVLLAVNVYNVELPFDLGQIGWPVFVIVPGLALIVVGLITRGEAGVGLTVAGAMVATIGGILAYQSSTEHWSSWAYAWALIAPTAVGAAMFLWGVFHGRGDLVRQGLSGLGVGLVLFLVGFAFFEGVLRLGGERGLAPLGRQALPIALIAIGVLIILSRLWPRRRMVEVVEPGTPLYTDWPAPAPPWASSSTERPSQPDK